MSLHVCILTSPILYSIPLSPPSLGLPLVEYNYSLSLKELLFLKDDTMFEDFSFSSPRPPRLTFDSDGDDSLMLDTDNDSTLISPLSSRCSSPQPSQRFPRSLPLRHPHAHAHGQQLPPTSVPFAYDHRRLSMGTLTRKLHEHTLRQPGDDALSINVNVKPHPQSQSQSARQFAKHEDACLSPRSVPDLVPGSSGSESRRFLGYFVTPPDTDHDDDDGELDDGSSSPSLSSPSSLLTPGDAAAAAAAGQEAQALNVRAQRQQISRLQCNPTDIETLRRALFSADDDDTSQTDAFGYGPDDCHPSSLLPRRSPRRRAVTGNRSPSRQAAQGASGSGSGSGLGVGEGSSATDHGAYRGRRKSSSGMSLSSPSSSHRIDKGYYPSSREMRKKSEQGLRRKSLVSAALASMVDRTL